MSGGGSSIMKCCSCFRTRPTSPPPPSAPQEPPQESPPPDEFICPISGFLMEDPVIVPAGHTFDRACIEACNELSYIPPILSSSSPSTGDLPSSSLVPNLFLKDAILNWCTRVGHRPPFPISQQDAICIVQRLMEGGGAGNQEPSSDASASGDEIQPASPPPVDDQEEIIFMELTKPGDSEKIAAIDAVYKRARRGDRDVALCTPRIMAAIVPMLWSEQRIVKSYAIQAITVFSKEPANRLEIVGCGSVPPLLHALTDRVFNWIIRGDVAITIRLLTEEQRNLGIMGALGAFAPLLEAFCYHFLGDGDLNRIARISAGTALRNLITHPDSLTIPVDMKDIIRQLLDIATNKSSTETIELRILAMHLLDNLAREDRTTDDFLEVGAVRSMVKLMIDGEGLDSYCLGVLHKLCASYPASFRTHAMLAGVVPVLAAPKQAWGEEGMQIAKAMLKVIQDDDRKKGIMFIE